MKRSRNGRDLSPVHPDAAAFDFGATMHVAVVDPDRNPVVLSSHRDRRCHALVGTIYQALSGNYREEYIVVAIPLT